MAFLDEDWAFPPRRHRRDTFLGDDDWDRRARRPYRCEVAHRHGERYNMSRMNLSQPRRRTSAPPVLRPPYAPVAQDIVYSGNGFPTINIYNGFSVDDDFLSIRHIDHDFTPHDPVSSIRPANEYQVLEDQRSTPPIPGALPLQFAGYNPGLNTIALNRAIEVARTELFVTLTRRGDSSAPKVAILNLATAQRLVLSTIQNRLVSQAYAIMTQDPLFEVDLIGEEIKKYCKLEP
jgi:hypothetical protein